jgi:phosphatidylethanolamine-binding protein (PEBP) family uncharacterized protein
MSEVKPKLHRYLNGYKGYLTKQGKVFKQWSSRFFVLDKRRLKFYENDSLNNLLGELLIDTNVHLYDINEEVDGYRNLFYLVGKSPHGGEENLFLSAANEKDKQDWLEAITDAVHDGFKQIFQPDLWSSDFYPYVDVQIVYRKSGVAAENGNIIRPSNTDYAPDVSFKGVNAEDRYSFIMLDIDPISSIENPSNKYYLHWGVINISGLDIRTGEQLAPYIPPAPVYNSGLHRFFFLLFKQRAFISPIVLNEITELFHKRDGFPFMKWVRLMDFSDPAGINGFYAGWEAYCDELHNKLNYTPPETFRSPNQESALKKEQSRKRIEQSMADLYRDLSLKDIFIGLEGQEIPSPSQTPISLQISYPNTSAGANSHLPMEMVKDGCIISISVTFTLPTITYEDYSQTENYYTLILTDPDFPSRVNPNLRELVHWVVVNIPSNRIEEGKTVLDYVPPAAPYASGLHRYVFILFKQTRICTEEEIQMGKQFYSKRMGIRSYDWVKSQGSLFSETPIGLEAFITEYEEIVDKTHEILNWIPPVNYQSAKQVLKFSQAKTDDLEDADAQREARIAELEYELKTSVLQTVAQLHSSTYEPPAPPIQLQPAPKPKNLAKDSGVNEPHVKEPTKELLLHLPVHAKQDTKPLDSSSQQLRISVSPQPNRLESSSIDSQGNPKVGIQPEEWSDRTPVEKTPLQRQNALNSKSFHENDDQTSPSRDHKLETIIEETPSNRSSASLRGLAILNNNNLPVPKTDNLHPSIAATFVNTPTTTLPPTSPIKVISPAKPFAAMTHNDLDTLFETSPQKPGEIENYDDDEEPDNASKLSKISSSNASQQSKPLPEGGDHRNTPNSLFQRMGLFKAQSQYIPSEENSSNSGSVAKPTKSIAKAASMYFGRASAATPPPAEMNANDPTKPKRLSASSSMYFKPPDRKELDNFRNSTDLSEAIAKCSVFEISTTSVFEGGEGSFSPVLF